MADEPGNRRGGKIGGPQRPWRRSVKIRADHGSKQKQRQRDADCELGQCIADRDFQIAGQPGEIAERDKSEDEKNGFGDRRHGSAE